MDILDKIMRDMLEKAAELITETDRVLVQLATGLIKARHVDKFHQLAAAALSSSGNIYQGLQHDAKIGQASICAEVFVIHEAELHNDSIATIVAVRKSHDAEKHKGETHVVSPCGLCRERLLQFSSHANVIIPYNDDIVKVPIRILLPAAYMLRKRPAMDPEQARQAAEEYAKYMKNVAEFPRKIVASGSASRSKISEEFMPHERYESDKPRGDG